jgi:Ca2+-binding RTX toxin-like protein
MTDIPANTSTKAALEAVSGPDGALFGTFSGDVETPGDHDWIKVELAAGQTYEFYLCFLNTGSASTGDATLSLRDETGTIVATATNGGVNTNDLLSFPVITGGTYFIDVGENSGIFTGTYSLFVAQSFGTTNKLLNVGNDDFTGLTANERIVGGQGADTINIGTGQDALGEQGNDIITGNASTNFISGGLGDDTIDGGNGDDFLFGDSGNDVITGGAGGDTILGGAGSDILDGSAGADGLRGGPGKDFLTGGSDQDIFDFSSLADSKRGASRDVITDFVPAFDQISVFGIDANTHKGGNQTFHFIGLQHFHHKAGELRYFEHHDVVAINERTVIQGDVNGDGKADFEIQLSGLHVLHATDFLL